MTGKRASGRTADRVLPPIAVSARVAAFVAAAEAATNEGSRQGTPRPQSIAEQIAAHLSQQLEDGELSPGDRILEVDLARQFAVSRGPVREALHLLHREGLVEILPRRGAHVAQPGAEEIRDLYEVRATLIGMAAGKAALAADKALLPLLRDGVETLGMIAGGDADLVADFLRVRGLTGHLMLRMAGNPQLELIIRRLSRQTVLHTLGLESIERRTEAARMWHGIAEAIERSDARLAERLGRDLVIATRDEIVRRLDGWTPRKIGKRVRMAGSVTG